MISPYDGLAEYDRGSLGDSSRIQEDYISANLGLVFYEVDDDVVVTNTFEGVIDFLIFIMLVVPG